VYQCRAAGFAEYPAAVALRKVVAKYTVHQRRAAGFAQHPTAVVDDDAICNCEPVQNGISIFTTVEVETSALVLAVNDAVFRAGGAADSNGFVSEINIHIPWAGVDPVGNHHRITVFNAIDCGLNVVEVRRPVVVNKDYLRKTG
jgi:hypothetical protein